MNCDNIGTTTICFNGKLQWKKPPEMGWAAILTHGVRYYSILYPHSRSLGHWNIAYWVKIDHKSFRRTKLERADRIWSIFTYRNGVKHTPAIVVKKLICTRG